jgi:hypothetical protein
MSATAISMSASARPSRAWADFIAELGYANYRIGGNNFGSDSVDGYRVGAGFRGMLAPKFEAGIKATYTDVKDSDGEFGGMVYGNFHINQTWGVIASYDHTKIGGEGFNTWGLGVRASF